MSRLSRESSSGVRSGQDQKAAFFAVFDRLGSTRAAARELELNANTCAGWVRKAGLRGRGTPGAGPHPGREEFFRLRKAGVSRREAARTVGVNIRTARDWDQGIRKSSNRRIYPDGRVIDYKRGVNSFDTPAGVMAMPAPGIAELEKPIDPRYLSLEDRERIRDLSRTRCLAAGHRCRPGQVTVHHQP